MSQIVEVTFKLRKRFVELIWNDFKNERKINFKKIAKNIFFKVFQTKEIAEWEHYLS